MSIAARRFLRSRKTTVTPPTVIVQPKIGWVDDGDYATATGSIRMPPHWARNNSSVLHAVLNVGVNELVNVTSSGTTYKANSIESRIQEAVDWNTANPTKKITVHIRLHVGERAPAYWKTACSTVMVYDEKFKPGGASVPRWWKPVYLNLYTQAMNALAPAINNNPIIGSVNAPGAAFFYPEPMLFFMYDKNPSKDPKTGAPLPGPYITNQERYEAAGWTSTEHASFMMEYPKRHAVFKKVVELDLNSGVYAGVRYQDFAQVLLNTMPKGYACLSNYSMAMSRLDGMGAFYNWMGTKTSQAWVGVQLARSHVVSSPDYTNQVWDDLADLCISKGYHFVETTGPVRGEILPDGTQQGTANAWPQSYADEPNTLLADTNAFKRNPGPLPL